MLFLKLKIFDLNLCETMKFSLELINYRARSASSMTCNWHLSFTNLNFNFLKEM